jgi:hypothetical protein
MEEKKRLRPVRFLVERYNRSDRTLDRWVELGLLPLPIYINGYRFWDEAELDRFDATRGGQSQKQKRNRGMPLGARQISTGNAVDRPQGSAAHPEQSAEERKAESVGLAR